MAFAFLFLFLFNRLEVFDPLAGVSFSQEVYDRNGTLLRMTLSSDEQYRSFRTLDQIKSETQQAVLLAEDQYFYYHWGVNPVSLVRAAFSLREARPAGASTITMQMVRLRDKLYTKSFSGKLQQMVYAVLAEMLYSKKQILQAYLNLTPYGANIEGVGAASLIYFNKDAAKLSLPESLLLAVIPQNPLKRNLQAEDSKYVFEAQNRLFSEWKKKYPANANNVDLKLALLRNRISELPFKAPHFVNFALLNSTASKIATTLDERIQQLVEKKLQSYIRTQSGLGIKNGAVLLIDTKTNEIKSWVGSNNFFDTEIEGQNDGILSRRSPGSALKPFLYGLAFDDGLIHPQSVLFDTPSSFGSYDPENFDRSYKGAISAEEALIQSRNVPAIYLASRLKQKSLYQLLEQAHIAYPQNEKYYGLSIALGSAGISALELAGLYTALAHQGKWSELKWQTGASKKMAKTQAQLLTPESTFMLLDILKKNPRSESAIIDDVDKSKLAIAWKTGTSYGFRDAWTVGLVGDHVLLVWLGNFDNAANPALIGRELAAPLFFQLSHLLKGRGYVKDSDWEYPLGLKLKSVDVCSLTGHFLNKSCPHSKKTWFSPGVSPIEDCQVHREVLISDRSNKRLCRIDSNTMYHKEVFEFWPSDIVQLFTRYGLPYKKTPAFETDCGMDDVFDVATPEIISPKSDVRYSIQYNQATGYDKIPLKAKVDQDVKKVFWFANQRPLGESNPNETLLVELSPGKYEIMVVDDRGQTFTKPLIVQVF